MFCDNCGVKHDDEAVFCPNCGKKIVKKKEVKEDIPKKEVNSVNAQTRNMNIFCVIGFAVSFISSILGIILCTIGLNQIKTTNEDGKPFAIVGIIISAAKLLLIFFFVVLFFIIWGAMYYGFY